MPRYCLQHDDNKKLTIRQKIFQTHYKENEEAAFPVYEPCLQNSDSDGEEDIENTDNEDDDDDEDIAGFSVENAYVEEKEEAILALKEIAQNTE